MTTKTTTSQPDESSPSAGAKPRWMPIEEASCVICAGPVRDVDGDVCRLCDLDPANTETIREV